MYTDLTYINLSYDPHLPSIVMTQKNNAKQDDMTVIAWLVIKGCQYNWRHPFRFTWGLSVEIINRHDNQVWKKHIDYGGFIYFVRESSGNHTLIITETADPMNIFIDNQTETKISVSLYRGSRLLAIESDILSGQSIRFHFDYSILCGTAIKVESGQPIDLKRIMGINQPIDIFGLRRGRIIMTGGGHGPFIKPLQFHLMKDEYW